MFSQKVPMGFGWRLKDIFKSHRLLLPILLLVWFFDKIGWLLEHTPFCFAFSGFWINRYLPRGRKIIQKYRQGHYSQKECAKLLKQIDHKLYGFWLLSFSPIILITLIMLQFASNFLLTSVIAFILHEFACSSSLRRWKKAEEMRNEELARMINRAGPSCLKYFHKFVLGEQT